MGQPAVPATDDPVDIYYETEEGYAACRCKAGADHRSLPKLPQEVRRPAVCERRCAASHQRFANDLGLPEDNDFTVFTPISMTRRGSTIELMTQSLRPLYFMSMSTWWFKWTATAQTASLPAIERRHTSLRVGQLTVRITSAPTASTSSTSTASESHCSDGLGAVRPEMGGHVPPRIQAHIEDRPRRLQLREVDLANVDVKFKPKEKQ